MKIEIGPRGIDAEFYPEYLKNKILNQPKITTTMLRVNPWKPIKNLGLYFETYQRPTLS